MCRPTTVRGGGWTAQCRSQCDRRPEANPVNRVPTGHLGLLPSAPCGSLKGRPLLRQPRQSLPCQEHIPWTLRLRCVRRLRCHVAYWLCRARVEFPRYTILRRLRTLCTRGQCGFPLLEHEGILLGLFMDLFPLESLHRQPLSRFHAPRSTRRCPKMMRNYYPRRHLRSPLWPPHRGKKTVRTPRPDPVLLALESEYRRSGDQRL